MRILCVCLGNICRSPLAEGILQSKVHKQGLDWEIDSAGTGAYHIGDLPDPRSIKTAQQKGIDITYQRARQLKAKDLDDFDLILTMDQSNYRNVIALTSSEALRAKVRPIMSFLPQAPLQEVPDPYWDDNGFEQVYQMLDTATDAFIEEYR